MPSIYLRKLTMMKIEASIEIEIWLRKLREKNIMMKEKFSFNSLLSSYAIFIITGEHIKILIDRSLSFFT
jgi:hypothetical protein